MVGNDKSSFKDLSKKNNDFFPVVMHGLSEKLGYEAGRIGSLVAAVNELQDDQADQRRLLRELRDEISRLKWRFNGRT